MLNFDWYEVPARNVAKVCQKKQYNTMNKEDRNILNPE